jgi:ABC-type transport system involved in multi-copper enzyme maturation permease subunit
MNAVVFSAHRVVVIARNTVREAVRQRAFAVLLLLAMGFVVAARWCRELNFGSSELKFIADFGFGALGFFGAALTIIATAQLFFSEIEHRTLFTLLAKPVRRSEFVMGKFIGVSVVSASFCVALTLLLGIVLWSRETTLMHAFPGSFVHGRVVDYAGVLAAGFAQWLKLTLVAGLTLLVATFARTQLFTTAAGFMIFVIGHLLFLAESAGRQGGLGIRAYLAKALCVVLPNFQLFDFSDLIGSGDPIPWSQVARLAVYAVMYAGAVCLLAALIFRRREI